MNTKNISLLGLGLFAAVALASCDNIEESLAQPITNPQEPIFNSANITYTAVPSINASNPEAGNVQVATYSAEGLPEGFTVGGKLELSPYADFSKMMEVTLINDGNALFVDIAEVASQYVNNFTKNPEVVTMYGRTILTASNGTDQVRLGTVDTYFGEGTYTFTPVTPSEIIAPVYYVVMGDGSAWDLAGAVKMNHSDVNQYDDPLFSVVIKEASSTGDKWILLSEDSYNSAKAAGAISGVEYFAPVYDNTNSGVVYGDLEKNGSLNDLPAISVPCEVEVNMLSKGFTTKAAVENFYATGNGWSNWSEHWMPLFTTDYADYYGFLNLGTEFKFAPVAGWNGDFGAANAPEESDNGGIFSYNGVCHDSGDNIKIGHEGLYFAHLNAVTWNYDLQMIKSWGLVGAFNDWNGDIEMTPSTDLYTWTAELTVEADQGWKFRANGGWDINLGGQPDALWTNGDNITLEAGTYTITLDLTTYPAKYTAVKK